MEGAMIDGNALLVAQAAAEATAEPPVVEVGTGSMLSSGACDGWAPSYTFIFPRREHALIRERWVGQGGGGARGSPSSKLTHARADGPGGGAATQEFPSWGKPRNSWTK